MNNIIQIEHVFKIEYNRNIVKIAFILKEWLLYEDCIPWMKIRHRCLHMRKNDIVQSWSKIWKTTIYIFFKIKLNLIQKRKCVKQQREGFNLRTIYKCKVNMYSLSVNVLIKLLLILN